MRRRAFPLPVRRAIAFALTLFCVSALRAEPALAPDCEVAFGNGHPPVALSSLRGEVLYVDFWASWCGPCVDAFPFLNDLTRDLGGKGLRVIGINLDDDVEDARAFLAEHPARFAVTLGNGAACARAFALRGTPASFVIDRAGRVRAERYGFRASEAAGLRGLLRGLLAEPPLQETP